MRSHVFVVDRNTFPVHRDRRFCGVKNPSNPNTREGLIADVKTLREGDLVFFYKRRIDEPPKERGFYGIYKIAGEPFYDHRKIDGVGEFADFSVIGRDQDSVYERQPVLPNRVLIEPVTYFDEPIPDNIAYVDKADPDQLWTMLFRKVPGPGRARSISHLLPEETEKVIRLLYKINLTPKDLPPSRRYPTRRSAMNELDIAFNLVRNDGSFRFENSLKAWLAEKIDKDVPALRETIGPVEDLEFFSPEVMYGIGGDKVDFLCLHRKKLDNGPLFRYKVTVMECKRGPIDEYSVFQVQRYSRWMAQLVPGSDVSIVQPVLVGHTASDEIVELAEKSRYGRQPIILEYSVEGREVHLERKL